MATWYRTGRVSVSNGNATISGAGTSWIGAVNAGDAFHGPDGRAYEIATVNSATSLTLVSGYLGSGQSDAEYAIQPTRGVTVAFNENAQSLIALVQSYVDGVLSGKFPSGSVGAPAIAGAGDPDTGISFPGGNRMAVSAGGARQVEVSPTEMKVDVPLTGSAVQSDLMSTVKGKVPLVGAFGWGIGRGDSPPPTSDMDDTSLPSGGVIYAGGPTENRPLGKNGSGVVIRGWSGLAEGQGEQHQIFGVRAAVGAERSELLHRTLANDGTWTEWAKMVHSENLLDPVQNGGVIERGSIGNDAYVRLADGSQWCFGIVNLGPGTANGGGTYANPHYTNGADIAFAAQFAAPPELAIQRSAKAQYTIEQRVMSIEPYNISANNVEAIRGYHLAGPGTDQDVWASYSAVGRWK